MPYSVWTVVPRGIKNDVLTLGIYVSPLQVEPDPANSSHSLLDKLKLDGTHGTELWTKWYENRLNDLLKGVNPGIQLVVNGKVDETFPLPLNFVKHSPAPQDQENWASLWEKLSCYQPPNWNTQITEPLPGNTTAGPSSPQPALLASLTAVPITELMPPSTAEADAADSPGNADPPPPLPLPPQQAPAAGSLGLSSIYANAANANQSLVSTSQLTNLSQHVTNVHAALLLAALPQDAFAKLAMHRALRVASVERVATTMADLSIVKPFDPAHPSISSAAADFQSWLREMLAAPDTKRIALLAQRNLYRLSDDPYHLLKDHVFPIVKALAIPAHRRSLEEQQLLESRQNAQKAQFIQNAIFHRRCQPAELGEPPAPAVRTPQPPTCTVQTLAAFYRTLTLLARFPEWLQRFGLAYTATVKLRPGQALDRIALTGFPTTDSRFSAWTDNKGVTSATLCTSNGYPAFREPGGSSLRYFQYAGNLLLLDPGSCQLVQKDLDGESLRMLQHANASSLSAAVDSANAQPRDANADPPDPPLLSDQESNAALPARSIGISLVHSDNVDHHRACLQVHVNQLRRQQQPNALSTLGLVDLVRGYSPEISVNKGEWISLTKRRVVYNNDGHAIPQSHVAVHLEAAVHDDTPSSTGTSGSVDDPHIPQTLFRWNGWSLTVRSPFPKAPQTAVTPITAPAFPISAKYTAEDDSLVRLRFGTEYSLRVRLIDLLGDPMPFEDSERTTLSVPYLRYDPVPPPELLLEGTIDARKKPGETLTTLVMRDGETDHLPRRCLCPPLASLDLLLQHGALDSGALGSENGFLSLDEIGSFEDVFIDPCGNFPTQDVQDEDGAHPVPVYKPGVTQPSRAYLPDPMGIWVQPEIVDLATQNVYSNFSREPFYSEDDENWRWPHAHRLRVQMDSATAEGPSARWETDPVDGVRTLLVSVPRGWQIKLRLKCVPGRENAELFAAGHVYESFGKKLLDELKQFRDDLRSAFSNASLPDTAFIHKTLGDGGLPQYTPSRDLIFVHAVQRPLAPSTFKTCELLPQSYDSPVAKFTAEAAIGERRSTGKVEFIAAWEDSIDGDSPTGILTRASKAQIAEYNLNTVLFDSQHKPRTSQLFKEISHTFPDTRCRILNLSVKSVGRFGHYYPRTTVTDENQLSVNDPSPTQRTLLSTSRPVPPRVVKIIPLLPVHHSRGHEHHSRTRTRLGGAFRIYLDRPWLSSGFGEMLGIVLWGEAPAYPQNPPPCCTSAAQFVPAAYKSWDRDPSLEPFVTRWGSDPARISTVNTVAPQLADFASPPDSSGQNTLQPTLVPCAFPAEMLIGKDDTHPKNIDPTTVPYVSLAAYQVRWQAQSQLWYCDVQIKKVPSYNCFLRLALARYQPNSLVNRECSPIVIAEFAQLLDGRTLFLQHLGSGRMLLQIYAINRVANLTGQSNTFKITLQYERDGKWLPAAVQPTLEAFKPVLTGDPNPLVASYTFNRHHHSARLVVEEYETWFADDRTNPGLRTTRVVARPPEILHIPYWSND